MWAFSTRRWLPPTRLGSTPFGSATLTIPALLVILWRPDGSAAASDLASRCGGRATSRQLPGSGKDGAGGSYLQSRRPACATIPRRACVALSLPPIDRAGQTGVVERMRAKVFWPIWLIVGFVSR